MCFRINFEYSYTATRRKGLEREDLNRETVSINCTSIDGVPRVLVDNVALDYCTTVRVEFSINRSLNDRISCVHFVQITHISLKYQVLRERVSLKNVRMIPPI